MLPAIHRNSYPLLLAFAGLLTSLYLAQVCSPLRLNTDSYRFLSMATSHQAGGGFLVDGNADALPVGYPWILSILIRLGLGTTVWINLLSIGCVLAGSGAFYRLLAFMPGVGPRMRLALPLLVLLSWVTIKHSALPVSENPYFALSFTALWGVAAGWRSRGSKAIIWFVVAALLALGAFWIRTIGISLVGTVCASAGLHPQTRLLLKRFGIRSASKRRLALVSCGLMGSVALWFFWQNRGAIPSGAEESSYLAQQHRGTAGGLTRFLISNALNHAQELGEIVVNIPAGRIPLLRPLFIPAGISFFVVAALGLPALGRQLLPLAVYALLYSIILLLWPFYDPRFWFPLLPLLFLASWLGLERCKVGAGTVLPVFLVLYIMGFSAAGLTALGFSTRLSFSGNEFPKLYGDGSLRDSYVLAFGLSSRLEAPAADERIVKMLCRIEPRAKTK